MSYFCISIPHTDLLGAGLPVIFICCYTTESAHLIVLAIQYLSSGDPMIRGHLSLNDTRGHLICGDTFAEVSPDLKNPQLNYRLQCTGNSNGPCQIVFKFDL